MAVPSETLYSIVEPELKKAWRDNKYKFYLHVQDKVNKAIQSALPSRTRELLDAQHEKLTAYENLQKAPSLKSDLQISAVKIAGLLLLTLFTVSGIAALGIIPAINTNTVLPEVSSNLFSIFSLGLVALTLLGLARYRLRSNQDEFHHLRRLFKNAETKYETIITKITTEELNKAINLVLRPQGAAYMPDRAPALVELSTTEVVQSRAVHEVRDFIDEHESSAIGIAGPRGIGKTTLLSYLVKEFNSDYGSFRKINTPQGNKDRISLFLSAPVYHNTKEFMTTLLLQLAEKVDQNYGGEFNLRRTLSKRRVHRQRQGFLITLILGLTIILGSILRYWIILLDSPSSIDASNNTSWIPTVVAVGVGMAIITAVASLAFSMSAFNRLDDNLNESQRLAFQLMEKIRYQAESSDKSDNRLTIFGRRISFADETTHKRVDRDPSLYQLSQDARLLLEQLSYDNVQTLIVVDELDKISKVDHLIEVVNSLKDLMHIPGCHTLVSVSIEALHSFELRGFASRDAFESTFDEIFDIGYLTVAESYEVINKRVVGFPAPLSTFCHIWSGGLPRELLRVARECVGAQRSREKVLTVKEIVQTVSATRINSLIDTVSRDINLCEKDREILTAASDRHKDTPSSELLDLANKRPPSEISPKVLKVIKAIAFEAKTVNCIMSMNKKYAKLSIENFLVRAELDITDLIREGRIILTENSAPISDSTVKELAPTTRAEIL